MTSLAPQQAAQAAPEILQKGLPYWLFYFLVCVILLLLVAIFLRDKNLRHRLSAFLSGAKRRMLQLRLEAKYKREKEKKALLWKELGQKAWSENVRDACVEDECEKLAELDREMHLQQIAWHDVYSKIEALGRQHEETALRYAALVRNEEEARKPHEVELKALASRKSEILDAIGGAAYEIDAAGNQTRSLEREVRSIEENRKLAAEERSRRLDRATEKTAALNDRVRALEAELPLLHEERVDLDKKLSAVEAVIAAGDRKIAEIEDERKGIQRGREREIREWLKKKERIQERIVEINRLMEPVFTAMGKELDETRVDRDELSVVYFQIDSVNKAMQGIQARIDRLRP